MSDMDWASLRACRMLVPEHVVHRALVHETVLLNVKTSTYHSLDEVGARFFEVMLAAPSLEGASVELASEYEQPVERIVSDLVTFCGMLRERELVDLRPNLD